MQDGTSVGTPNMIKVKRKVSVTVQDNKYDRGKYEWYIDRCGIFAFAFCLLLIIFGITAFIIAANDNFTEELPTWLGTLCIILAIGLVVCFSASVGCCYYQRMTKEAEYEIQDQVLTIPKEDVELDDVILTSQEKYTDTIKF